MALTATTTNIIWAVYVHQSLQEEQCQLVEKNN